MAGRVQFDEAVTFSQVRLRVQDSELKQGKVAMMHIRIANGAQLERPWGEEGGFAIVYKFRTQSGQHRALRCFKSKMNPDTQYRYERMSDYFQKHAKDITAGFRYHDIGIRVDDPPQGQQNYSILDMEWIEGKTLLDRIDELCKKRDRAALEQLANQWVGILRAMRQAQFAHGDMAANNVMVRADGRLVLVDYDGVYIPEFASIPSATAGQLDYQHPNFLTSRPFNEYMDDFPNLVIYTALFAVSLQPEMWGKYVNREKLDVHIMFKLADFLDHTRSIWHDLDSINNARLKIIVQKLKQACKQPVEQVRFPFESIDPDFEKKKALADLEKAIKSDDEEQIVKRWVPLLDNYSPAQQHRQRVALAQQRAQPLIVVRNALKTHNIQQIASSYDPILDGSKALTVEEQERIRLALVFMQACNADDDDAVVTNGEAIQNSPYARTLVFTPQEEQRIDLARRRQLALNRFLLALHSKHAQAIAADYDAILDTNKGVSKDEREAVALARNFVKAYRDDDDEALLQTSSDIENFVYARFFAFTPEERRRVELAQERNVAMARFMMALDTRNIQQISDAYDDVILDNARSITQQERERLALARNFNRAYHLGQDEQLTAAYDAIQSSQQKHLFVLTPQEEERVREARQYMAALTTFRQALQSRNAFQIAAAYSKSLDNYRSLTEEERERWQVASEVVAAYQADDDKSLADAYDMIQNLGHLQQYFLFTPLEEQRIQLAVQRRGALTRLQAQLFGNKKRAGDIVNAYDPALLDDCKSVTTDERTQLETAREFLQMYQATQAVLKNRHEEQEEGQILTTYDRQILAVYKEELAEEFIDFTEEEQKRINLAVNRSKLEQALQMRSYGLALRLARTVETASQTSVHDFQLTMAKQKYLKHLEIKELTVGYQGDEVFAQWQWPNDDLIEYAELLWRTDTWPQHPKHQQAGTARYRIIRSGYDQAGGFKFLVGQALQVYIQVYLAIYDYDLQNQLNWYYSNGDAKRIARRACTVRYWLNRNSRPLPDELEIATSDGSPLPELVVVRKAGNIPRAVNDGDVIAYIDGTNGVYQHRTLVPLDTALWPDRSIVRVFPVHNEDISWLTIESPQGLMLEVN